MFKRRDNNKLSNYVIVIIIIVYSLHIFSVQRYKEPQKVIMWDVISHYAYLPAYYIDKDIKLTFWENKKPFNQRYWPSVTENGNFVIKTTMGVAILYAPFFFVAHATSELLGYDANGFTVPYAFFLQISTLFYVILGFIFLRNLLLIHFKDKIVSLVLIIIAFGTNLYWYATTRDSPMSHGYSFFLFAYFLYLNEHWQNKPKYTTSIQIGLVSGLLSLIRPTNAIIAILFIAYNIKSVSNIRDRLKLFINNYKHLLIILILGVVVWIPQFAYWKFISGSYLYYSYGNDEKFFFNEPFIFHVLFGFRKGWLIYTPVMIFSIVGIFILRKQLKAYFIAILSFFILNIYIISSWWCWWYGGSFGMRPLIESYAILAIPFAAFLRWTFVQKHKLRIFMLIILVIVSLQSSFHTVQYYFEAIHWDSMTKEAYFDSFWRTKPTSNFYNLLESPDYENARKGIR